MLRLRNFLLLLVGALGLGACSAPPTPPPGEIEQGMAEALFDTGFYSEVGITQMLGRHYEPGKDVWNIIACYQFALADGSQSTNCVDSFNAFQMDNGIWIVSVTINQVYRWRSVSLPVDSPPVAVPAE